MADQTQTDQSVQASAGRTVLEKTVKQQVMLSIGLTFEEKDDVIRKLPNLTEEQLQQLHEVFNEESDRKQQMLTDFFAEHPELYPEFERFSKQHVNSIYRNVEEKEKGGEEEKMQELLTTHY